MLVEASKVTDSTLVNQQIGDMASKIGKMSDTMEMLARHSVTTQHHTEQIKVLATREEKIEDRINEIEPLIHQACEMKGREIDGYVKDLYKKIDANDKETNTNVNYKIGAVFTEFTLLFGYAYTDYQANNSQDIARDNVIFEKLDKLIEGQSDLKKDVAVNKLDIQHMKQEIDDGLLK